MSVRSCVCWWCITRILAKVRCAFGYAGLAFLVIQGPLNVAVSQDAAQRIAEKQVEAPRPNPPETPIKPAAAVPKKPASPAAEPDFVSKREESLLTDQIEVNRLLQSLGPDHPKVKQIQQRMKITQDWIAERRKTQKQVAFIKIPGRNPKDFVKILADLYGDKVKVVVDEKTGTAVVMIAEAKSKAEANDLINDIENTAKRLELANSTEVVVHAATPAVSLAIPIPSDEAEAAYDQQARQLAADYLKSDAAEQAKLLKSIESITEKQFEHRIQLREKELELLIQRVESLKAGLARRKTRKADIIQKRIRDLLDPDSDLKWEEARSGETARELPIVDHREEVEASIPTAAPEPTKAPE